MKEITIAKRGPIAKRLEREATYLATYNNHNRNESQIIYIYTKYCRSFCSWDNMWEVFPILYRKLSPR